MTNEDISSLMAKGRKYAAKNRESVEVIKAELSKVLPNILTAVKNWYHDPVTDTYSGKIELDLPVVYDHIVVRNSIDDIRLHACYNHNSGKMDTYAEVIHMWGYLPDGYEEFFNSINGGSYKRWTYDIAYVAKRWFDEHRAMYRGYELDPAHYSVKSPKLCVWSKDETHIQESGIIVSHNHLTKCSEFIGEYEPAIWDNNDAMAVIDCKDNHDVFKVTFTRDVNVPDSDIYAEFEWVETSINNEYWYSTITTCKLNYNVMIGTAASRIYLWMMDSSLGWKADGKCYIPLPDSLVPYRNDILDACTTLFNSGAQNGVELMFDKTQWADIEYDGPFSNTFPFKPRYCIVMDIVNVDMAPKDF